MNSNIGGNPSTHLSQEISISRYSNSSGKHRELIQLLIGNQQVNKINIIISLPGIDAITRGLWKELNCYNSEVLVIDDGRVGEVGKYGKNSEVPEKTFSK